jgi:alkylated DNA repair dioxygenase AlkB
VYLDTDFLSAEEAESVYQELWKHTAWETSSKINRWVKLCHDVAENDDSAAIPDASTSTPYKYRDAPSALRAKEATPDPLVPFSPILKRIQTGVQEWYERHTGYAVHFNVCLLNFYETGQQRIGWHVDREELGRSTPIASVSLGATRTFLLRNITGKPDRATLALTAGSLLVMENVSQHLYMHSVPKEPHVQQGRINLTFRCKTSDTLGETLHEKRDHWLTNLAQSMANNNAGTSDPTSQAANGWSLSHGRSGQCVSEDGAATSSPSLVFGDTVPSGLALDSTLIRYLVKTNLGAERYCGAEIQEQLAATFPDCPSAERGGVSPLGGDLNGATSSNAIPCWTVMARPCGMDGYVAVCSDCAMEKEMNGIPLASASSFSGGDPSKENLVPLLLQLRSAHYVLQYHAHFDLKDCYRHVTASSSQPDSSHKDDDEEENVNLLVDGEMLYEYCKQRLLDGTLSVSSLVDASSFRVTCERIGIQHAFAAPQVERYASTQHVVWSP